MPDWVHAAERAYVAAATGGAAAAAAPATAASPAGATSASPAAAEHRARALAAAGAIASHYLAVGTPRSFGIVIAGPADVAAAALSLVAHRAWFQPRDLRCASLTTGADELASATAGRVVSLDEALACDIVNVYATALHISPAQLRRGTHVNALAIDIFDPELLAFATVVREAQLPSLAAGLVDGRQLDELTLFTADGAPIALSAVC
ncbi:MAG TPA: hypothetical protein VGC42_10950 [Kofleriaceae bacterium]